MILSGIHRFFFSATGPGNLGFSRMLFFGLMLWFHLNVNFTVWAELPASFNNRPTALFQILHLPVVDAKTLAIMEGFWKFSLLLACIGLFTRMSTVTAFLLGIYLLGVPHNFGKTGHGDGILVLTMGILAGSRCGDAWSLDRLLRSYRAGPPVQPPPRWGEYNWPIKCIWLLSSMVFFAAGVAKLRFSGIAWITSDNMANMLLQHHYHSDPIVGWGRIIAGFPLLCKAMAAGTVILELAFPLAMFSRWARWILVSGMFVAQVGIALLMGVLFTQFMFVYLFWISWDSIGQFILKHVAPLWQTRAVFYDGGCGLCRKTVAILHHLDLLRRCETFDVVHQWSRIEARFGQLSREECFIDMHVISENGKVYKGFDAYRSLAWVLPATWILLPILYLPPVRWLGWKVYRFVATHRHDAGCELPAKSDDEALEMESVR